MTDAAWLRQHRAIATAAGRCSQCTTREAAPGRKRCARCIKRDRLAKRDRVAAGLCDCGNERAPGYRKCDYCIRTASERQMAIRVANLARGMCARCGAAKPAPGRTLCEPHLESSRTYRRSRRAGKR